MKNFIKKSTIINKLEENLGKYQVNNNNLDSFLTKLKIKKDEFYMLFPNKIKSLCIFYFQYIYLISLKKAKINLLKEKSISKKTSIILLAFINCFVEKKKIIFIFFKL